MKFVIVCNGPIYAHPHEWIEGALVQWYDPDFNKGEGKCQFTRDIRKAMLFDELGQAVAYVQRVPVNHPFTESGTINRPIHCFEIQYRAIEIDREKKAIESPLITTPSAVARFNRPPPQYFDKETGTMASAPVMAIRNLKRNLSLPRPDEAKNER
jgi:hypothetical protein